ncbi:hypothetical protein KY084_05580 [Stakelama sp. CBK3Z-3]|uniref:Uncharacterized protein n=1 Tax=Stakelama flava TaxID=2860338 RepID=A0ABS6XJH8_9SPHN|nr:hypothetical protein [Stakelama flava]MBW4330342.1 hypothetical protein [Stakelama flava]
MANQSICTETAARHPFRGTLHIRASRNALRRRVRNTDQDSDWKLFVLSFSAFFVCFYTFIA